MDKLADTAIAFEMTVEIYLCLMLKPQPFGASFKSHYCHFMARPGANFNSTQACGLWLK